MFYKIYNKGVMMQGKWIVGLMVLANMLVGADFDWMNTLNNRYSSDTSGFRSSLNNRFDVGDAVISSVVKSVAKPSDAYMILKLAEMSGLTHSTVLKNYEATKNQGWGAMAQSLGIKPGSAEFKALKAGHDIDSKKPDAKGKVDKKEKEKGNDNDKGKGKKGD